jgi:hypothetical protein
VAAAGCLAREPFRFRSFPLLTQTNLALAVSSGRVVGYTEVIQDGHPCGSVPGSRHGGSKSNRSLFDSQKGSGLSDLLRDRQAF